MYFRRKTSAGRAYLQIVESRRDGDQVRQQVIATLGRYEDLQASGQLERLLQSGVRFVAKAMVLAAAKNDETTKIATRILLRIAGGRITRSPASTISSCITSIGRWHGWARNCPTRSRTGARRLRRAVRRTSSKRSCSRIGAICLRDLIWCSWTPPACTLRGPAGRRLVDTASVKITAPIFAR
jgi:hypothetical protein